MYYDYHKIISYNCFLNFLIGERGVGKTYGATKFVIFNFIKKGEQFVVIRRYKNELKETLNTFFDSMIKNNEFPEHQLTVSGNKFYIDGEIAGFGLVLSTSQNLKGSNFDRVTTIIFDEFAIEPGQKKYYLSNDPVVFLNLVETIARMRDVRIFMLGNPADVYTNPYFTYLELTIPYNTDIKLFKNNLILVQYMYNEEYREAKRKTKLGQIVEGTTFGNYAIENKQLYENNSFIEKKLASSRFTFAFIYNNETYGVWFDFKVGKIFVSTDYDPKTTYIFACTLEDHKPNTLLLSCAKQYTCWKNFIQNYKLGNVRFENQKIKLITNQLIKTLITI